MLVEQSIYFVFKMSWLITLSRWFSPNFRQLAKDTGKVQVITISISHYAEMAVWALQLGGVKFQEHGYAPAQHIFAVLNVRVGGPEKYLSKTSRTSEVSKAQEDESAPLLSEKEQAKARRRDAAARSTAVPVAVCPDGKVLVDSWIIAAYSGLAPIEPSLQRLLDEDLGPLARQLAYSHILKKSNMDILDKLFTTDRHIVWRLLWSLGLGKETKKKLLKTFQPYDQEAVSKCRAKVATIFQELDSIVAGRKQKYLGGDSPGVADIALASLAAPLINPPLYVGGKYEKIFDSLLQRDAEVREETRRWRETVTGAYVLEMYQTLRMSKSS